MGSNPRPSATVFVDADNTLWDTNRVYADAQLSLLGEVERAVGCLAASPDRLTFLRSVDQELAERHHTGLRYPPILLAHAVALAIRGSSVPLAVRQALKTANHGAGLEPSVAEAIKDGFLAALNATPLARVGVEAGLKTLHAAGDLIIVVTEGSRDRIVRTAAALGLGDLIDRIVEAPKQARLYQRIARLSDAPVPMFMVGDQLQRDIAPAKAAGLETIYFPGDFNPKWEPAEEVVRPDHRIENFEAVARIVAAKTDAAGGSRRTMRRAT